MIPTTKGSDAMHRNHALIPVAVTMAVFLAGCGSSNDAQNANPQPAASTTSAAPVTPSASASPTASPTPTAQPSATSPTAAPTGSESTEAETSKPSTTEPSTTKAAPTPRRATRDTEPESDTPTFGDWPTEEWDSHANDDSPADMVEDEPEPVDEPEIPQYEADVARTRLQWIVEDIITADERSGDFIRFGTPLSRLSTTMYDLQDLGAPEGVDPAELYALTGALAETYGKASDYYFAGDDMNSLAAYSVAREHTAELFDLLNPALGTSYSLP